MKIFRAKLKRCPERICLFALDCDGVLTDGAVYVADNGQELRRFHILDGVGIKRLMAAGIQVAVISSASCAAVKHRMQTLGVEQVYIGVEDKLQCLRMICGALGISLAETAYMGDDLPDLPVMQAVGWSCAPANAIPKIKRAADYCCRLCGGNGAVREASEMLITKLKINRNLT